MAFRVSVLVRGASFKMTGTPKNYLKLTADSGKPRIQAFCPHCGSPKQNWFRSALPWIATLPAIAKNERSG